MAVLSVTALDGVGGGAGGGGAARRSATTVLPGGRPTGTGLTGTGPTGEAVAAECSTSKATVETAVAAYTTLHGSPPPDMAALVDDGILVRPVDTFELRATGSDVAVVGRGVCAGR
jgi:hypothetical protein